MRSLDKRVTSQPIISLDAMSWALRQISHSLLSKKNERIRVSSHFVRPIFVINNGKIDPLNT